MLLCACQAAILGRREQARFLGEVRFLTRDNVVCEAMCEATVDRDLLGRTHIDFECFRRCCCWPWIPACPYQPACLPVCLSPTGRHIYHLLVCLERRPGRPCSPTSICKQQALSGSPCCHNEREASSRCLYVSDRCSSLLLEKGFPVGFNLPDHVLLLLPHVLSSVLPPKVHDWRSGQ